MKHSELEHPAARNPSQLACLAPPPGNVLFTRLVVGLLRQAGAAGALPLAATAVTGTAADTIACQERLADAGRNPLTGSSGMIFRLYGAASGGTPRCAPSPGFGRSWSGRLQRLTSSSRGR